MRIDFRMPWTSGIAKKMLRNGKKVMHDPINGGMVIRKNNKFFELLFERLSSEIEDETGVFLFLHGYGASNYCVFKITTDEEDNIILTPYEMSLNNYTFYHNGSDRNPSVVQARQDFKKAYYTVETQAMQYGRTDDFMYIPNYGKFRFAVDDILTLIGDVACYQPSGYSLTAPYNSYGFNTTNDYVANEVTVKCGSQYACQIYDGKIIKNLRAAYVLDDGYHTRSYWEEWDSENSVEITNFIEQSFWNSNYLYAILTPELRVGGGFITLGYVGYGPSGELGWTIAADGEVNPSNLEPGDTEYDNWESWNGIEYYFGSTKIPIYIGSHARVIGTHYWNPSGTHEYTWYGRSRTDNKVYPMTHAFYDDDNWIFIVSCNSDARFQDSAYSIDISGDCSGYSNHKTGLIAEYLLFYQVDGELTGPIELATLLFGNSDTGPSGPGLGGESHPSCYDYNYVTNKFHGQRIIETSCFATSDYLCYTYVLQEVTTPQDIAYWYQPNESAYFSFVKRVVGVIYIKTGTKYEYEVTDEWLSDLYSSLFNKQEPTAIGILTL
jgi:hypothetical protein